MTRRASAMRTQGFGGLLSGLNILHAMDVPEITQETLAEMIGITRSRVSFLMNKFRQLGFIEYNGRIRVRKSLLNVILNDQSSEQNAMSAPLVKNGPVQSKAVLRKPAAVGVKVKHHDGLKD
jgi:hypothetical protein